MRFRQVHLDFHTSEAIPGIGSRFSPEQFQEMLRLGHVDSVTVFAKCHHGWSYHPTETNEMHPELNFDLLGAMIEAAHAIDVKTPVYISAGLDEKTAGRHPEWLMRDEQDRTNWVDSFLKPGYHQLCLHSPYLDRLIRQIEEVVSRYDADGLFLDIVGERMCWCHSCLATLRKEGQDPRDAEAVRAHGQKVYANYTRRVREAVDAIKPGLPVFHNGGHIRRGRRDLAVMNTHLELESLPTGGWGYDHFPLSVRYAQTLGMDYLGMTGKFHKSWGEFGGYKHPNALRYETALSLANGAACSIGDQLHPEGRMDEATYTLIGAAYAEVEAKEPWCVDTANVADIALLSVEAAGVQVEGTSTKTADADAGAVRVLLEGGYLFDVIDLEADFTPYKVLILPDHIAVTQAWKAKLLDFTAGGGKVLATGTSGLNEAGDAFAIDLGVRYIGENPYRPDYVRPAFELGSLKASAFIIYAQGQRVELAGGIEWGVREDPYFNREPFRFCSHQHTPSSGESGGPGIAEGAAGIYFAWNVFEDYAETGSLPVKEMLCHVLDHLLDGRKTAETTLPAQGIITLQEQKAHDRSVLHLLYATPVRRGKGIEIIEDLVPLRNIEASVRVKQNVKKVYLAPQQEELAFEQRDGVVHVTVPEFTYHQMIVFE